MFVGGCMWVRSGKNIVELSVLLMNWDSCCCDGDLVRALLG